MWARTGLRDVKQWVSRNLALRGGFALTALRPAPAFPGQKPVR